MQQKRRVVARNHTAQYLRCRNDKAIRSAT